MINPLTSNIAPENISTSELGSPATPQTPTASIENKSEIITRDNNDPIISDRNGSDVANFKAYLIASMLEGKQKPSIKELSAAQATEKVSNNQAANKYNPVTLKQMDIIISGFSKRKDAQEVLDALNAAMERSGANTPARQAMVIAQTAEETGSFTITTEGGGKTAQARFNYYLNGESGKHVIHSGYGYRNGNNGVTDGIQFIGRGYTQLTGKSNYANFSKWMQNKTKDTSLKSQLEGKIKTELKEKAPEISNKLDEQIETYKQAITNLQTGAMVKKNGRKESLGIEPLEKRMKMNEEAISTLETRIKTDETAMAELKGKEKLSPLEVKKLQTLKGGVQKLEKQLTGLKGEHSKLNTQLKDVKTDLVKLQQNVNQLENFKKTLDSKDLEKFNIDLSKADFTQQPYSELVGLSPTLSSLVTEFYWTTKTSTKGKTLNELADQQDVTGATQTINGGLIGITGRKEFYEKAKTALGVK